MSQLSAVNSRVSGKVDYVSNRFSEEVHPMGIFGKVEPAVRILGYHGVGDIGKNAKNRLTLNSCTKVVQSR
jgi:hypothetical protein